MLPERDPPQLGHRGTGGRLEQALGERQLLLDELAGDKPDSPEVEGF
jgi:hypothetical protein